MSKISFKFPRGQWVKEMAYFDHQHFNDNESKSRLLSVSINLLRFSVGPKLEIFCVEIIFNDYQTW